MGSKVTCTKTGECSGFVTFAAHDQASVMWVKRCEEDKCGEKDETVWVDAIRTIGTMASNAA